MGLGHSGIKKTNDVICYSVVTELKNHHFKMKTWPYKDIHALNRGEKSNTYKRGKLLFINDYGLRIHNPFA